MNPSTLQPTIVELERRNTFTALGIRFWDPVQDVQVRDGLRVLARSEQPLSKIVGASQTASGIYAFHGLPSLREVEFPTLEGELAGSPPRQRVYRIEVFDTLGRFLPVAFEVELPLPFHGPFTGASAAFSPPGTGSPGFYLFSGPARSATAGFSVLRASLLEWPSLRAADHAGLEIEVGGVRWFGFADQAGQAAVVFPTPRFERRLAASPPISGDTAEPAQEQIWELTLRVRFSRAGRRFFEGIDTPDFRSLIAQSPALILRSEGGPAVSEWTLPLTYLEELYPRTAGRSEVLVEAGSPP